jgi:hypothetical protein
MPRDTRVITGRVLTGLAVAFCIFDASGKLLVIQPVVEGMTKLGWPVHLSAPVGAILLTCLTVHLIPRTAVLGAVLLTGFFGGAVASQMRIEAPLPGFTLFPVYMGILIWGGLYLRQPRLKSLFPLVGAG